jgi:IS30 family transposase
MPRLYVQLDLDERRKLYRYREKKPPFDEIARLLGRHTDGAA